MEEDIKIDTDREKRRADMKAFNEMMKNREAERKACDEKMMSEWQADRKKGKADYEKMMAGQVERRSRRIEDRNDGLSREDGGQDRDRPGTKQYRDRDRPGRSGGHGFGGKPRRNGGCSGAAGGS
jgi:hypothetical protein